LFKHRTTACHSTTPRVGPNKTFDNINVYDSGFTVHRTPKKIRLFPDWLLDKPDFRELIEMDEDVSIQYAASKTNKLEGDRRVI